MEVLVEGNEVDLVPALGVQLLEENLKVFLGKRLIELEKQLLYIASVQEPLSILVQLLEYSHIVFLGVSIAGPYLPSHHLEKLGETNASLLLLVQLLNHIVNDVSLGLEAEELHHAVQVVGVDVPLVLDVDEIEKLFVEVDVLLVESEGNVVGGVVGVVGVFLEIRLNEALILHYRETHFKLRSSL